MPRFWLFIAPKKKKIARMELRFGAGGFETAMVHCVVP